MESSTNKLGNIFSKEFGFSAANPFAQKTDYNPQPIPQKRINGYDSTILNQANFADNPTEELSMEYRIKEKETILKELDAKIKAADNYGTQNEALGLKAKRQRISEELTNLKKQQIYGGRVLGETPSTKKFKEKRPVIYKIKRFISRYILARLSKKIKSVVTLTDSLEQLSQISQSVDELIEMNVPYGEKMQNYEKLTGYLNQANKIHTKIAKSLGK